jgi:hypothetical protein
MDDKDRGQLGEGRKPPGQAKPVQWLVVMANQDATCSLHPVRR